MKTVHTDVLIIGTGCGAAAPALRLAEAGVRVVMVEKGPKVQTADFRQTSDPQYLLKYIQGTPGDHLSLTYAEALGGGSGFYEMVSLRAPSLVFDQTDAQGRRLWPEAIDRAALDPYYDIAERMLHVSQIPLAEVPKTGLVFAQLMKNLGYGRDYRYAHDEPDAYAAGERYFPDDMPDRRYYHPAPRGLEQRIGEALARLRARGADSAPDQGGEEKT